ncbi:MAG: hypothetical protein ACYTGG_08885 [Planctomycetota bacterium]
MNLSGDTAGADGLILGGDSILDDQGFRILVDDVTESAETVVDSRVLTISPATHHNDLHTDLLLVQNDGQVLLIGDAIVDVDTSCPTSWDAVINGADTLQIHGEFIKSGSLIATDGFLPGSDRNSAWTVGVSRSTAALSPRGRLARSSTNGLVRMSFIAASMEAGTWTVYPRDRS